MMEMETHVCFFVITDSLRRAHCIGGCNSPSWETEKKTAQVALGSSLFINTVFCEEGGKIRDKEEEDKERQKTW